MTPHHKETNFSADQPVRFYKIIALTFLVLTLVLFGAIVFIFSKKATITISTKAEPVNVDKLLTVGPGGDVEGMVTTTIVKLSKKFSPTGSVQEPAIAEGKVTLYNDSNTAQSLVATTRLLTAEGVLFRLKNREMVPAKGQVVAEVYADQVGASGNIGPVGKFTIPGLTADKQKEIYGKSTEAMTGGLKIKGVLSADDIKNAENSLYTEMEKNGKEAFASRAEGKPLVYSLIDKHAVSDTEAGKEITEFTVSGSSTLLAVSYDENFMKQKAQEILKNKVMGDEETLDSNTSYTVALDSFDQTKQTASLKLTATGVVRLNPESQALAKTIFFGKSADEVRRYLLSLDRVSGVDIKFSPAWIFTVPHVADHVSVIVKEAE